VATHICLGRKIYISENRFGEFAVARWPGGHSYLSSRKIYISENELRLRGCGLSAKHSISFAFHFAVLCSGHRGHPGHRVFFGAVSLGRASAEGPFVHHISHA
jgi:hypothetical protein